ncbi:spore germination protein GerPE [Paenibacillus algorifonticola]|uniref:spore germination protein GerPE n=1 Tax=Paenibacillus algorifonticola TaxID=684063 RepID=UPI003D2A36F4
MSFPLDYPIRTAEVGVLTIISASGSAIVQLGDRGLSTPKLRALALQREISHDQAGDVYFESYDLFTQSFPSFDDFDGPAKDMVHIKRTNHCPRIVVGCVYIIAMGSSSSVQAGNAMETIAESRIKHIRQFKRPIPVPGIGCPLPSVKPALYR